MCFILIALNIRSYKFCGWFMHLIFSFLNVYIQRLNIHLIFHECIYVVSISISFNDFEFLMEYCDTSKDFENNDISMFKHVEILNIQHLNLKGNKSLLSYFIILFPQIIFHAPVNQVVTNKHH